MASSYITSHITSGFLDYELINKYSMFKWLVNAYMKTHINELVDQRLNEKMFERYYEQRQTELRQRIETVRKSIHTQTSGIQKNQQTQLLSSSNVQTRGNEPIVPPEADQAKLNKTKELADIKAKLMGKKK